MISKRITTIRTLLVSILVTASLQVLAQSSEYNIGNYWIFATAEKSVGLDFENAASGVFMNNGTVYYKGNFKNDGTVGYDNTLTVNPGLSVFNGTAAQTLSGSGTSSFYKVQVVGVSFSLKQPVSIVNQLDLSNGIVTAQQTTLETRMNAVQLADGSSCINASSNSFIDGFVQKTGNTAFSFPIGNSGHYRPLSIAAPTTSSDAFAARYIYADPTTAGYSRIVKASGVGAVSDKEYWTLQQVSGSSLPPVTLTWNSSTSATVPADLSLLQVVRWDGSKWISEGNVSTSGDATAGTITANVTGYGVMSLAVKDASRQLSVKVLFEGLWNSTNSKLNQCITADGVTPKFATAADTVTIELHDPTTYSTIVYRAYSVLLEPDGTIHSTGKSYVDIPGTYKGNYYLTVKSRNHIETTTASPISFANEGVSYDFTTASSQAYSNNLVKLKDGVYGVYAGDVNQDGMVDNMDIVQVHAKIKEFAPGYLNEELNGDGVVDNMDKVLIQKNAKEFVYAIIP